MYLGQSFSTAALQGPGKVPSEAVVLPWLGALCGLEGQRRGEECMAVRVGTGFPFQPHKLDMGAVLVAEFLGILAEGFASLWTRRLELPNLFASYFFFYDCD